MEGRDVFRGDVDVIVCDGFIGNIALKISEGLVEHVGGMLKKAIKSSIASQVGYVLSKQAFDSFRKRTDSSEYGGAPLLGVNGITIIGHGRSNATGVKECDSRGQRACAARVSTKNSNRSWRHQPLPYEPETRKHRSRNRNRRQVIFASPVLKS